MKGILLLCVIALSLATAFAGDGDLFDKFDIKSLTANLELRMQAFNCLMDKAPCGDMQIIKDNAPRIIKTSCGDCTPGQKEKYEEMLKKFEVEHNAAFKEMMAKFS